MKSLLKILMLVLLTIAIEKFFFKSEKTTLSLNEKFEKLLRTKRNLQLPNKNDQECLEEGDLEEGHNLKSYFLCESTNNNQLLFKEHFCDKGYFFNWTIADCSPLPGGGDVDCIAHAECPDNFNGITTYPLNDLQRNYIICLTDVVIIAKCDVYFDNNTQECIPKNNDQQNTTLIDSNCNEIEKIECTNPDVIEIDEKNSGNCSNCYYFCIETDKNMYELTIWCFGEISPELETTETTISELFTKSIQTTTIKEKNNFEVETEQSQKSTFTSPELSLSTKESLLTEKATTETEISIEFSTKTTIGQISTEISTSTEKEEIFTTKNIGFPIPSTATTTEIINISTIESETSLATTETSLNYSIFTSTELQNLEPITTSKELEILPTETTITTEKETVDKTIIPLIIITPKKEIFTTEKSSTIEIENTETTKLEILTSTETEYSTETTTESINTIKTKSETNLSTLETTLNYPKSVKTTTTEILSTTETSRTENTSLLLTTFELLPKTTISILEETAQTTTENLSKSTEINASIITELTSHPPATTAVKTTTTTKNPKHHPHCIDKGLSCVKEGYFRLNNSCTEHYECYYSKFCQKLISSRIYKCPKCLKFNAKQMCCDLPDNVPECANLYVETPHTYASKKIINKDICTGPGTFTIPDDCNKYYDCKQKSNNNQTKVELIIKTCPKDSRFNRNTKQCEKGHQCRRTLPKCKSNNYYVGDKNDCTKFYHCVGHLFLPLTCPAGTIYDGKRCEKKTSSYLCDWESLKKKLHRHRKF